MMREGGRSRDFWLSALCMVGLALAAFEQGVHALQGNSYRAAAWVILDVVSIYLLSKNVRRGMSKD
jgi:hypothetical protein